MACGLNSLNGSSKTGPLARPALRVPPGYILVSEKWRGTALVNNLQGQVKILYEDDLGVVDFHPSTSIGVVYVSEADIAAGAVRYRSKLVKLRMVPKMKGVVCVERTSMTEQYVCSIQKFTVLDLGLTLLLVSSQKEAASMLASLVRVEYEVSENPFNRSRRHISPFVDEDIVATVMSIPRLGEVKARLLLTHFSNLQSIAGASEMELAAAVGSAAATHIKNFFCTPP